MKIHPFKAQFPRMEYITSADSFFGTVKERYPDYIKSGFFESSTEEALYVYQIADGERIYTGLVGCLEINEYFENHIKKHEHTLPAKEQQQIELLLSRGAAVKPVLLTYENVASIDEYLISKTNKAPSFSINFEEEQQKHHFWCVKDPAEIKSLEALFKKEVKRMYVADGHHRIAATSFLHNNQLQRKGKSNYGCLFCAFLPLSQLKIWEFNRIVTALDKITPTRLMAEFSKLFEIEVLKTGRKPLKKHEMTLFVNQEWYALKWKKEVLGEKIPNGFRLDADRFNQVVFQDILGIEDTRNSERIENIEGFKEVRKIEKRAIKTPNSFAICFFPIEKQAYQLYSDQEKMLPPKSTWFEPRMKNGVIVMEY